MAWYGMANPNQTTPKPDQPKQKYHQKNHTITMLIENLANDIIQFQKIITVKLVRI